MPDKIKLAIAKLLKEGYVENGCIMSKKESGLCFYRPENLNPKTSIILNIDNADLILATAYGKEV